MKTMETSHWQPEAWQLPGEKDVGFREGLVNFFVYTGITYQVHFVIVNFTHSILSLFRWEANRDVGKA